MFKRLIVVAASLSLAACGGGAATPTAQPTALPLVQPTAIPAEPGYPAPAVGYPAPQPVTGYPEPSVNEEPRFAAGDEIRVPQATNFSQNGLGLTFRVIEDSRCPADAICVQPGTAVIEIIYVEAGLPAIIQLATDGNDPQGRPDRARINGYDLRLTALEPYPGTTGSSAPPAYEAVLVVE